MAVLPSTPEVADDPDEDATAELADLRRRAYGPNADIAGDAVARARLEELEGRVGPRSPDRVSRAAPEPEPGPGQDRSRDAASAAVHAAPGVEATPAAAVPGDTTEPADVAGEHAGPEPIATVSVDAGGRRGGEGLWARLRAVLRERRTWVVAGPGAVAGAVIAIGLVAYPWSAPDRVLQLDREAKPVNTADYAEWLPSLGVDLESARSFESVRGFVPWTVDLEGGGRCLVLSQTESSGILDFACVGDDKDPTLDVLPAMWSGNPALRGSAIRFVARGDTVEVWFSGPQPTTGSAERTPEE